MPRQKLYCYVDESGQDTISDFFIVVAVLSDREQEEFRKAIVSIEQRAGIKYSKWHSTKVSRRLRYIELAIEHKVGHADVFFSSYPKPLPYLLPMIEVLERAIKLKAAPAYTARVFVDGIDRKKAAELTNALRLHGVSLEMVRGRRDESEPIIRLADMWAGCIRGAVLGKAEERALLRRATEGSYITRIKEKPLS